MARGQTIFDTLAGMAGHPINRAGLNLQIAEGQAMNAYRDAETQDAFQRARMARDQAETYEKEQNSIDHLASSLTGTFGDPDLARAAATDIYRTGGLKNFYAGLNEQDIRTLEQRYQNANVNDRPALLEAILAAKNPEGLARIQAEGPLRAAQEAAARSEVPLHEAQTQEALARAHSLSGTANGLGPDTIQLMGYQFWRTGRMPPLGMGNSPIRGEILNAADQFAEQQAQNPDTPLRIPRYESMLLQQQQFGATTQGLNASARSTAAGGIGTNVNRITTATNHLELLQQSIAAMHNGNMVPLNHLAAVFGINTGQAAPLVAQMTAGAVGSEVAGVYAPAGSTQEDRKAWADNFAVQALSPDQGAAAIGRAVGLMQGKMDGNEQEWIQPRLAAGMPEAEARQQFRTQVVNDPLTQRVFYGAPAATSGPPGGAAPTPPAASTGPAGAPPSDGNPPRLTQTPPGTPGGTPAGAAPGPQAAPPPAAPGAPAGHEQFPTVGPHGFAPPTSMLKQAANPQDPGINHLSNGEIWSWRAGDVPRYVGIMPVPTPGQGTTQTPNLPTGAPSGLQPQ